MSYTLAAALGVVSALLLDMIILRTRLVLRRVFWAAYPLILAFQLIFNGVLTGRGVVRYDEDAIIGVRIFSAPVEDMAFGFALVLMSLSCWIWWERVGLGRRSRGGCVEGTPRERRR